MKINNKISVKPHEVVFDVMYQVDKFRGGKSVLQIGGCTKKHPGDWGVMFECFKLYGYDSFDILEIADYIKDLEHPLLRNKIQGNVMDIENFINQTYDVIFWWRGPEHLKKEDVKKICPVLRKHTKRCFVVGTPLGTMIEGPSYNNIYNAHLSHWQPQEFLDLGFSVLTCTAPHTGIIGIQIGKADL